MRSWVILILVALLSACNSIPPNEVIDGILEVPENRLNPDSRTLKLVYKVLRAKIADSLKAPILYLQGGPGGPTLIMEEFWKNHPLRNERDIVLMDQRGTGFSETNFSDIGDAMFELIRQDLDQEGEIRALNAILSNCKETIKQKGIDLAGYNSRENAADFEDLRKTLGYKKWNLYGGSYGSRLGLTMMRDFPNSVRSAVFLGIMAPESDVIGEMFENFENSLITVLERCKRNQDCNYRYPNLKERFSTVMKKIQTEPLHFGYEGKPFVLNSQDAYLILYLSLFNRQSIDNIPLLIEDLENGNSKSLKNAVKVLENVYNIFNWPMNFSVLAYEEFPFYNATAMEKSLEQSEIGIELPASFGVKPLEDWHANSAPDFENRVVISEIPTLMASGSLDPVTPVINATEALKFLKNGYGVVFPDESHDFNNPCFFQIVEDFMNNPFNQPDLDCSSIRKPLEWNLRKPAQ